MWITNSFNSVVHGEKGGRRPSLGPVRGWFTDLGVRLGSAHDHAPMKVPECDHILMIGPHPGAANIHTRQQHAQ